MFRASSAVLAAVLSALALAPAVAGADGEGHRSPYARALLQGADRPEHWWRLDGDWFSADATIRDRPRS